MQKRAFTLVELLVVVAIIAALLALLLPSLNKAREMAKQVTCMSQQRQVGLGFATYMYDFNGALPGAYNTISDPAHTGTENRRAWYQYFVGPQYYVFAEDDGADPGLGPKSSKTNKILRCIKSTSGTYAVYDSHHPSDCKKGEIDGTIMTHAIGKLMSDGFKWNYSEFRFNRGRRVSDFLLMGCSTVGENQGITSGIWQFSVSGPMNFNTYTDVSLWGAHLDQVDGLFGDFHAEGCDTTRLLSVSNQPKDAIAGGMKAWQLMDGANVYY